MGLIPFALNDFKVCFTLFPKCSSSFVHTTCSLSVLAHHLAFADVHLPVCTALSNCATHRLLRGMDSTPRGQTHTLRECAVLRVGRPPWSLVPERFVCLRRGPVGRCTTIPQLPDPSAADSSIGCDPGSLAVTAGITVVVLCSAH
jgi:hypothetical protein